MIAARYCKQFIQFYVSIVGLKKKISQFIKWSTELFNLLCTKRPDIVLGDFNEDLSEPNPKRTQFMKERGFVQLISTRTNDSGSIIDHIYFYKNTSSLKSKVLDTFSQTMTGHAFMPFCHNFLMQFSIPCSAIYKWIAVCILCTHCRVNTSCIIKKPVSIF